MKKLNGLNQAQFNKLAYSEQVKEVKRMAKRANVRLSLLEESGIINEVYNSADQYNTSIGRDKNRFSEGTKYKNHNDVKDAYKAISNFLNNKTSTLSGISSNISSKVNDLIEAGQFDYKTLRNLSEKEKIYIAKEVSKKANKQLKALEHSKIDKYGYEVAQQYNESRGRKNNRFYTGGKFKNEKDLNIHIQNASNFLKLQTSTARGYVNVIKKRLNTFKTDRKGKTALAISDKDEQKFLDFISSKEFEKLKQYADSDQILETFVDARNADIDIEKILQEFEDYKNTNIGFDEVQERLGVAKYKEGGLLH
jgi:hypothetical protein